MYNLGGEKGGMAVIGSKVNPFKVDGSILSRAAEEGLRVKEERL